MADVFVWFLTFVVICVIVAFRQFKRATDVAIKELQRENESLRERLEQCEDGRQATEEQPR